MNCISRSVLVCVQTKGLTKAGPGGVDRGTPYAMAPEQLDSETQHVTFKADAWAFGIMLIELFHPAHAVRARTHPRIEKQSSGAD